MARPLRIEFPGAFYHVTARGNERKPIYREDLDREQFLALLADAARRFHVVVHAYVLMRNHYHLLLETPEANLSRTLRQLNGHYTQAFNRRHHRVGHLLQGRYTAILVDQEAYLVELSRYIHLNPVRVGEVRAPAAYPWSSAAAYVGRRAAAPFLCLDEVLAAFGPRRRAAQRAYAQFLRDGHGGPCPWDAVVAQTLLGAESWVKRTRQRLAGRRRQLEVPATRQLPQRPAIEEILRAVSGHYGIAPAALCQPRHGRGSGARGLAMWLAYECGGRTQAQIAERFGVTHFAVSRAIAAQHQRVRMDRKHARAFRSLYAQVQT